MQPLELLDEDELLEDVVPEEEEEDDEGMPEDED